MLPFPVRPASSYPRALQEGTPRDLKKLITTHEGKCASVISAKVNRCIELVSELHIKGTIECHELEQVKFVTQSISFSKVVHVILPMLNVNGPLLGKLVLVIVIELMHNAYLECIPELGGCPGGNNGSQIWILKANLLPISLLPFVHWLGRFLLGGQGFLHGERDW